MYIYLRGGHSTRLIIDSPPQFSAMCFWATPSAAAGSRSAAPPRILRRYPRNPSPRNNPRLTSCSCLRWFKPSFVSRGPQGEPAMWMPNLLVVSDEVTRGGDPPPPGGSFPSALSARRRGPYRSPLASARHFHSCRDVPPSRATSADSCVGTQPPPRTGGDVSVNLPSISSAGRGGAFTDPFCRNKPLGALRTCLRSGAPPPPRGPLLARRRVP